ncbi:MAG: OmpP1/FadL family transporter [Acetobacteraceae bacterium]
MRPRTGARIAAVAAAIASTVWASPPARATDGYLASGYGMKEVGRGGAGYAVADDAMGGANNPASMSFAGARVDLGFYLFSPSRSASRSGNAYGLNGSATSGANLFAIPEFGYNRPLGARWDIGITVYGNGGMNTDYPGGQIAAGHCGPGAPASNLLCGQGKLGVDLSQIIVAPTLAYKITPTLSIGLAPLFAFQRFAARGLQAFGGVSSDPAALTDTGYSNSYGAGVRVGVMWKATPRLSFGATYQSRIFMSDFARYKGLFAGGGGFDIPSNFGVGVAFRLAPTFRIAADYERILYGDVKSVGNPSTNQAPLGAADGPGFGWHDVNVYRVGFDWRVMPALTLRAGYNHTDNPITARDVTFNILAPGVVTDQVSFGFTWRLGPHGEISAAYSHAFSNTVSGPTSALLPGGGTDSIKLSEDEGGIAFGWRF